VTSAPVGPLRLVRALVVAGAVVGLAVGAHRLGGGVLPDPLVVLALGALVLSVTSLLAGRKFTVPVLTLVLGAGQVALHAALTWLAPVACMAGGVAAGSHVSSAHLGHGGGAMSLTCASGVVMPAHAPMDLSPAMVGAHVAATAVTVLVIASGERALWWLLTWLRPRAAVADAVDVPVVQRPIVVPGRVEARRRRSGYLRISPRRGPPARVLTPSPLFA
jgi:hypothetical protein